MWNVYQVSACGKTRYKWSQAHAVRSVETSVVDASLVKKSHDHLITIHPLASRWQHTSVGQRAESSEWGVSERCRAKLLSQYRVEKLVGHYCTTVPCMFRIRTITSGLNAKHTYMFLYTGKQTCCTGIPLIIYSTLMPHGAYVRAYRGPTHWPTPPVEQRMGFSSP